MEDALGKFIAVSRDPYGHIRRWKEGHRQKVVGCAPMHFPEELVHAAGLQPVVLQDSEESITIGHNHIHPFFCRFACGSVDAAFKGKLDFLDGVIFPDTCLQLRTVCEILLRDSRFAYIEDLQFPIDLRRPYALSDSVEQLERVKGNLQQFSGCEIGDDSLRRSIILYNKNRGLLRSLYEQRRQMPGILSAKEMQAIVRSSMVMSKEEHTILLERLLAEIDNKAAISNGKVNVFLSAHLCEAVSEDILDIIEQAGAVVVDDDLYSGYRYFAVDADEDGPPIEALAKRYLNQIPCPTRLDLESDWGQYLVSAAKTSEAQGIIQLVVKYCEPHLVYYPHLKATFQRSGLPHLLLETERDGMSLGAIQTRIQAFVEMIEGEKVG